MMDDIVNKLTPAAKQVLELAKKEAERLKNNYVGTEHLLLGIIEQGKSGKNFAIKVLANSGIEATFLLNVLESKMEVGSEEISYKGAPFTPRVKKVLSLALKEAESMKCEFVGPEHILLGILREGDGLAANVLKYLVVNLGKMRADTIKELGLTSPQTPEQTPKTDMEKVLDILNGSIVISDEIGVYLCNVHEISFTVIGRAFKCNPLLFACFAASAESDGYLGLKKLHSVIGEMLMKCEGEEKK